MLNQTLLTQVWRLCQSNGDQFFFLRHISFFSTFLKQWKTILQIGSEHEI